MARAEIPATAGQVYTELSPGVLGYKEYGCRIVTGIEADMGQACNVTLLMSGTDGRVLQVLRSPLRPQFNRGIPISPFQHNPPIAADLDGDGNVEIISGADVWRRAGGPWTLAWQGARNRSRWPWRTSTAMVARKSCGRSTASRTWPRVRPISVSTAC